MLPSLSLTSFEFGTFTLVPCRRALYDGEVMLRLGSRAFDILVELVHRAGEVIPAPELLARVWPDSFVEPGTLRVHVAALRKALNDTQGERRMIANVPAKGYCFVAPMRVRPLAAEAMAVAAAGRRTETELDAP